MEFAVSIPCRRALALARAAEVEFAVRIPRSRAEKLTGSQRRGFSHKSGLDRDV